MRKAPRYVLAVLLAPTLCLGGSPYAHITATTYKTATRLKQTAAGWRALRLRQAVARQTTSGTVIGRCENGDGLILTCAHGKPKGAELTVEFRDQYALPGGAKIVAVDEARDLCLIRARIGQADVVEIAAREPKAGDRIRLIGFGHEKYAERSGELTHVGDGFLFSEIDGLFGDSGGAVLNEDGELCGVIKATTAKDRNRPARPGNENDSISVAGPVILKFLQTSDDWKSRHRDNSPR